MNYNMPPFERKCYWPFKKRLERERTVQMCEDCDPSWKVI